ncbi:hypothetical protein WOLCODRAFT_64350, partial [Wolfiporia cocos MD-104 SS10]
MHILALTEGPYLALAAAVYTKKVIVEDLASISLHVHYTNSVQTQAGEHVTAALRVALPALRGQYLHFFPSRVPADFPSRDFST